MERLVRVGKSVQKLTAASRDLFHEIEQFLSVDCDIKMDHEIHCYKGWYLAYSKGKLFLWLPDSGETRQYDECKQEMQLAAIAKLPHFFETFAHKLLVTENKFANTLHTVLSEL